MAQVTVVLTATFDNGKVRLKPGSAVSMAKSQAEQLIALGMARIVLKAAPAKEKTRAAKGGGQAPLPPPAADPDGDPDDDPEYGEGESGDGDSGEGLEE